jgi:hypothetical protein
VELGGDLLRRAALLQKTKYLDFGGGEMPGWRRGAVVASLDQPEDADHPFTVPGRVGRGRQPGRSVDRDSCSQARLPLDLEQRLTPWRAEHGENRGGEQELQACWEPTRAVPAVVVEEFSSARAQERKDVLEVRRGARRSAKCRRIERASPRGEEEDAREAAADLEPTRMEVSVRDAVARNVEDRPQNDCCERAACGTGRSACRHVEGNYHGCLTSRMPAAN